MGQMIQMICSVFNCEDRTALKYSLPKDPFIRGEWMKVMKNPEMLQKNHITYKVCQKHFQAICINAIPTLNIRDSDGPNTYFSNPKTSGRVFVTPQKIRAAISDTRLQDGPPSKQLLLSYQIFKKLLLLSVLRYS